MFEVEKVQTLLARYKASGSFDFAQDDRFGVMLKTNILEYIYGVITLATHLRRFHGSSNTEHGSFVEVLAKNLHADR